MMMKKIRLFGQRGHNNMREETEAPPYFPRRAALLSNNNNNNNDNNSSNNIGVQSAKSEYCRNIPAIRTGQKWWEMRWKKKKKKKKYNNNKGGGWLHMWNAAAGHRPEAPCNTTSYIIEVKHRHGDGDVDIGGFCRQTSGILTDDWGQRINAYGTMKDLIRLKRPPSSSSSSSSSSSLLLSPSITRKILSSYLQYPANLSVSSSSSPCSSMNHKTTSNLVLSSSSINRKASLGCLQHSPLYISSSSSSSIEYKRGATLAESIEHPENLVPAGQQLEQRFELLLSSRFELLLPEYYSTICSVSTPSTTEDGQGYSLKMPQFEEENDNLLEVEHLRQRHSILLEKGLTTKQLRLNNSIA